MSNVVVIGGGPAGIMAACTAAESGNHVILLEKNTRIGRKLMITGKGRCNVTNDCSDVKTFVDNIPVNGRFLYSAFSEFTSSDTMRLFESLNVPLKVERGNRVFPVSDKAVSIVDALNDYLKRSHVKVIHGSAAHVTAESGFVTSVVTEDGRVYNADAVVIATGGKSYPTTGSTGDGYRIARELGHTITDLSPSLVPIESTKETCLSMQGIALKNVEIKITDNDTGKTAYKDFGEMLFTHFGVSGPVILSASSHLRKITDNKYTLHIDLKPALSHEQLDARIIRDFEKLLNKDFQNSLGGLLPSKMIPVIVKATGISPEKKVNQITKEERNLLINALKDFELPLKAFRPIDEAIVTSGGISIKEIMPKTMESKIVNGLYFAGEIIDVDAYTGGFNLQIAFSTGYVAGKSIGG